MAIAPNPFYIIPGNVVNSLPLDVQDHVLHRYEDATIIDVRHRGYDLSRRTMELEYFCGGERVKIEWTEAQGYSRLDGVTFYDTREAARALDRRLIYFSTLDDTFISTNAPAPETEEERANRKKREAEERKRELEATRRAEKLLFATLTDEQKEDIEKYKKFDVIGSRGGKYTIGYYEGSYNIEGVAADYCLTLMTNSGIPYPDIILAQKLLIETNELEFLRVANEDLHGNRYYEG